MSTAQIVTRARIVVTTLVDDFLRLLYEPRQLLTARATGTSRDVAHALVFLCVSQLLGGWLVLQEWPTRSGTVDFLTTGPVFVLLAALLLSIPMYAAWRIAGAPREYQRVLVILLYQGSFVGMALSLIVFSMLSRHSGLEHSLFSGSDPTSMNIDRWQTTNYGHVLSRPLAGGDRGDAAGARRPPDAGGAQVG